MKFSKLRLAGFKTFVEATEVEIAPGLTGIVGPNGCGKSNLLEAMRWVMGETSSRNMRAADMDDVIFNGSGRRPARNHAEVALVLDDVGPVEISGIKGEETLEVARRIERGAGSTYRINGREVRARDVQVLFADASTGARSPAMVRQGQIAELISARPAARRAILEEASGISGLNSRRHEAELRLKAAEQNLERLDDALTTLNGRLDSLDRQSRQASRYRTLSAEIRTLEATLGLLRWRAVREAAREAEAAHAAANTEVTRATAVQAEAARAQGIAAMSLPALRQRDGEAGAAVGRAKRAIGEVEAEAQRVKARLGELAERLRTVKADSEREERLGADMAEALARLSAEEQAIARQDEEGSRARSEAGSRRGAAEARVLVAEEAHGAAQQALATAEAGRASLARQVNEARGRLSRAGEELARAERIAGEIQARARSLPAIDGLRQRLEEARAEQQGNDASIETIVAEVQQLRRADDALRGELNAAEQALNRIETEAKTLARVLAPPAGSRWRAVIEDLTVAPGLELAIAAALGDDLDAGLEPRAALRWQDLGDMPAAPLPERAESLAAHVQAPAALRRRLSQIGIVARADGPALQKSLQPGQRLVSREGDLWRWDGFTASAEAPTPAARRLEARNRLSELEAEARLARTVRERVRNEVTALRQRLSETEGRERQTRERLRDLARRVVDAQQALTDAERLVTEIQSRSASAEESLQRARRNRDEVAEALARLEAELAAWPDISGLKATQDVARADLAAARAELSSARAAEDGLAGEAGLRSRRREAIARERESWQRRATEAAAQRQVLQKRREEAESEQAALKDVPDQLAERRQVLLTELKGLETTRDRASDELVVAEKAAREADQTARAALAGLTAAREALIRAEERRNATAERREAEVARIAGTFECAPGALAQMAGIAPDAPLPEAGPTESRLERLKADRERLGAVNLRADEEATETRDQLATMEAERTDLIEAIRRLRGAIQQIDHEARERLRAAFETVDGHFRALFTELFGGGEAELKLVDSEDLLEAGLEIFARPPGKRPSTMSLLSGGEQALTAIALIFAVFLTNPAPVCVLDEVDAPLDDANVERWCDLLAHMAERTETRFLVVTHNPITMARMSRLFGVTMSERGVSQLVSVDLGLAEGMITDVG